MFLIHGLNNMIFFLRYFTSSYSTNFIFFLCICWMWMVYIRKIPFYEFIIRSKRTKLKITCMMMECVLHVNGGTLWLLWSSAWYVFICSRSLNHLCSNLNCLMCCFFLQYTNLLQNLNFYSRNWLNFCYV